MTPGPPAILVEALGLRGRFIAERHELPNVATFGAADWFALQCDPYVLGLVRYSGLRDLPCGGGALRMAVAGFLGVERVVVNLGDDRGVTLGREIKTGVVE